MEKYTAWLSSVKCSFQSPFSTVAGCDRMADKTEEKANCTDGGPVASTAPSVAGKASGSTRVAKKEIVRKERELPRNYFDEWTGKCPANEDEAKRLWRWRLDRPCDSIDDVAPFDYELIMTEIKAIRKSLRTFVKAEFHQLTVSLAKAHELVAPKRDKKSATIEDVKSSLKKLKRTEDLKNETMVYKIFFKTHRDRTWLSRVIDLWAAKNNYVILGKSKESKKTRNHEGDRGGFSVVAREARSQVIKGFMRLLFSGAGWNIASQRGQGAGKINVYTPVKSGKYSFYVVTKIGEPAKKTTTVVRTGYDAKLLLLEIKKALRNANEEELSPKILEEAMKRTPRLLSAAPAVQQKQDKGHDDKEILCDDRDVETSPLSVPSPWDDVEGISEVPAHNTSAKHDIGLPDASSSASPALKCYSKSSDANSSRIPLSSAEKQSSPQLAAADEENGYEDQFLNGTSSHRKRPRQSDQNAACFIDCGSNDGEQKKNYTSSPQNKKPRGRQVIAKR